MTDTEFLPSGPAFPPRRAVELDPEAQRAAGRLEIAPERTALDRIADALTRIADYLAVSFEPEPEPDERTGEPEAEPPIDAALAWSPVKGGRARLRFDPRERVIDRVFESEGETWAVVVDESGDGLTVPLDALEPPR